MITRLGVCTVPEPPDPNVGRPAVAPLESYVSLHDDFAVTLARVTPDLGQMFPEPDKFVPELTDGHVDCFTAAGILNYLNPSNAPAYATGGLPVLRPGIDGGAAWWLATQAKLTEKQIRAVFERARATDNPAGALTVEVHDIADTHVNHFARYYRAEQSRTWSRDDPIAATGEHAYGAKGHEAADAITGDRSWMLKPETVPRVDPDFMLTAGQKIGEHFGPERVRFHGPGNEFGNDMCYLPIRFDGANFPGGQDVVREQIYPDYVLPYLSGLYHVRPAARVIFGEHDGADIMRRCRAEEKRLGIRVSEFVTFHPYGPPSRVREFVDLLEPDEPWGITEIADDDIAEWLDFVLGVFVEPPQCICFLQQQWLKFYKDWWRGGKGLELTEIGRDVQTVIRYHTRRRRAAGR